MKTPTSSIEHRAHLCSRAPSPALTVTTLGEDAFLLGVSVGEVKPVPRRVVAVPFLVAKTPGPAPAPPAPAPPAVGCAPCCVHSLEPVSMPVAEGLPVLVDVVALLAAVAGEDEDVPSEQVIGVARLDRVTMLVAFGAKQMPAVAAVVDAAAAGHMVDVIAKVDSKSAGQFTMGEAHFVTVRTVVKAVGGGSYAAVVVDVVARAQALLCPAAAAPVVMAGLPE